MWNITQVTYVFENLDTFNLQINEFKEEIMEYMMRYMPDLKEFNFSPREYRSSVRFYEDIIPAANPAVSERFLAYLNQRKFTIPRG